MELNGKTVLVTGGSRGIGAAIVRKSAEAGADVCINYRSSGEEAENLAEMVRKLGRKATTVQADVSDRNGVDRLFESFFSQFDRLDVLINNAGISYHKHFLELTDEDYDSVMNTNLRSCFLCSRAAAAHMAANGHGKIINNSSMLELVARPNLAVYAATKGAMGALTRSLALDLASKNIQVNNVCPGIIATEILGDKMRTDHAFRDSVLARIPAGRMGDADEVAELFVFLASERANYITGASFVIDGGIACSRI